MKPEIIEGIKVWYLGEYDVEAETAHLELYLYIDEQSQIWFNDDSDGEWAPLARLGKIEALKKVVRRYKRR